MYILETENSFDAAHFLSGYEGKCRNLHGHRWRVIARIGAKELNRVGQTRDMVLDFGDFKDSLKKMTDTMDHTLIIEKGSLKPETLKALKEEAFAIREFPFRPTAERFAEYFFLKLKEGGFPVISVSVYETPENCATWEEAGL
ncbi:MAG: 6-carboxytetrahydropterin synthase [Eubacterium sp.]|nr:6-carboxytetrahydropterin synthase [Eubacterium sp.]